MTDHIEIHPGVMRQLDHRQAVYTGTAEALIATRVNQQRTWIDKAARSAVFKKIWHLNEVCVRVFRKSVLLDNKGTNRLQSSGLNFWCFSRKTPPKIMNKKKHRASSVCRVDQMDGIAKPQNSHVRTCCKTPQMGRQLKLNIYRFPFAFLHRKIVIDRPRIANALRVLNSIISSIYNVKMD
ncbi:hypothetical protein H9K76_14105 [Diaphorobacter ruginosibacter]|uniref:Uncharacterized protein n=1 Tax=Diaphorobacter ruginosibacter TaxID=1715720 RepID=A0A7G9RJH2_9BURK|nr:hypothetical protein [Diaphorobacter ruginosibacter]QNN55747.1 hypothetical protein H9K76_14105 [Diaphorobacter ruginosibacter]